MLTCIWVVTYTWLFASYQKHSQQIIDVQQFFLHTQMLSDQAKELSLGPWWFGSIHLSRLGWSRVAYRWSCSNVRQLALIWMYGQIAEDRNYLWFRFHSYRGLKWRCWCSIRRGEPFVCWENTRTLLSPLATRLVETELNKKSIGT